IDQITTSFYFTNFPEDIKPVDLWELFAKFGKVGDVYIPNKVDKWGKRFGFVKFKDVKDVEEMSRRLVNVWSGSFKLQINHSRFGRNAERKSSSDAGTLKVREGATRSVNHEVSFKDLLIPTSHSKGLIGGEGDIAAVKVPVDSSLLQNLKQSFVGFLLPGAELKGRGVGRYAQS
ncbi:RNA-binding protein 25-like, partial [Trifolium medium]|nr:RNA-binding protein 25-like [Trifolium medium]